MGPHTLIGFVATEAGGTVPVYMCSAWAGPEGSGGAGSLSEDAADRVKAAFSEVLGYMCYIMNSTDLSDLAAASVQYFHSFAPKADTLLLCPKRHGAQDAQAFTTWSGAALQEFHRCWYDPATLEAYCNVLVSDAS